MSLVVRPILLGLILLLAACGQEKTTAPEPRVIEALTLRLALTEARECRSLPGQVQSRNSVTLSSKLSGTVTEVLARRHVDLGAFIQAGEIAATLFSRMVVPVMYYLNQRDAE